MKEKVQILSSFTLKIIAMVFMVLDHIGSYMLDYWGWSGTPLEPGPLYYPQSMVGYVFRLVGRISLPLFALLLAEGMRYSKNRGRYLCRLASIEAILLLADVILYNIHSLGFSPDQVAFSDLLSWALFIYLIEKKDWKKYLAILPLGYIIVSYLLDIPALYATFDPMLNIFPLFLWADYSLYGFLIFLGFYYAPKLGEKFTASIEKNTNTEMSFAQKQSFINAARVTVLILVNVIFWAIYRINDYYDPYIMQLQSYAMIACLFIFMHNGKRGYDSKWWRYFEYLFYPVHLALIGLIFAILLF